jgi:hypothetical protein
MKRVLLLGVLVVLSSTAAHAQRVSTETGNTLLEECESKTMFDQGRCLGYILGASDLKTMDDLPNQRQHLFCTAPAVINGQIVEVVVKYLKDHPENRHCQASTLVMAALIEAFPCSAERTPK